MWNAPTGADLAKIPSLYSTDGVQELDKIIHEHFFIFGSDWYAAEYDKPERLFYGYAILNADHQNAEWGYFLLDDLKEIVVHGIHVDRDKYWEPTKASKIEKIALRYNT